MSGSEREPSNHRNWRHGVKRAGHASRMQSALYAVTRRCARSTILTQRHATMQPPRPRCNANSMARSFIQKWQWSGRNESVLVGMTSSRLLVFPSQGRHRWTVTVGSIWPPAVQCVPDDFDRRTTYCDDHSESLRDDVATEHVVSFSQACSIVQPCRPLVPVQPRFTWHPVNCRKRTERNLQFSLTVLGVLELKCMPLSCLPACKLTQHYNPVHSVIHLILHMSPRHSLSVSPNLTIHHSSSRSLPALNECIFTYLFLYSTTFRGNGLGPDNCVLAFSFLPRDSI